MKWNEIYTTVEFRFKVSRRWFCVSGSGCVEANAKGEQRKKKQDKWLGSHGVELQNLKKFCLCVGWPDHSRSLQGKDAEYCIIQYI